MWAPIPMSCGPGANTSSGVACPLGHYCTDGVPTLCAAGSFGSSTRLSSASCSGPCNCNSGTYCPAGSSAGGALLQLGLHDCHAERVRVCVCVWSALEALAMAALSAAAAVAMLSPCTHSQTHVCAGVRRARSALPAPTRRSHAPPSTTVLRIRRHRWRVQRAATAPLEPGPKLSVGQVILYA
jgi:hypothetical protein